jgi:hypothetical protein
MKQNLGVAMRLECESASLEFGPQFEKIINTAVEHQTGCAIGGNHWLVAGFAQIQNGQAPMPEDRIRPFFNSLSIRPAAVERRYHDASGAFRPLELPWRHESGNATHIAIVS